MKNKVHVHRLLLVLCLFIYWPLISFSQNVDPQRILDKVKAEIDQVIDYQADIEIEVDVEFIRMPNKQAHISFKQPDKIKFDTEGFLMLPKKGADFALNQLLSSDYNAIYSGTDDTLANTLIIQVLPLKKRDDIVLATIWVDTLNLQVTRMETFTKNEGSFIIQMSYGRESNVLPEVIKVTFEVQNMNMPVRFVGKSIEFDREKFRESETNTGTVYIRFSNYQINTGLKEEEFNDQ